MKELGRDCLKGKILRNPAPKKLLHGEVLPAKRKIKILNIGMKSHEGKY